MNYKGWLLIVVMASFVSACPSDKKARTGFSLPDGDVQAGRAAFLELKCHSCHAVTEENFPAPTATPPVPVRLGQHISAGKTDGELMTSIINPSHSIRFEHMSKDVAHDGTSRMGDYADVMTVRQMLDLVAFLHSKYRTAEPRM